jgi:hypothetical protein
MVLLRTPYAGKYTLLQDQCRILVTPSRLVRQLQIGQNMAEYDYGSMAVPLALLGSTQGDVGLAIHLLYK